MQGNTFFGFSGGGGSTPPPVSNSWLLNGNTEGAEKYFGTNDNFSIPIYTNGSAIGVFTNTGDFGFGTISPTSRVHIVGDSTSSNYSLKIDNSAFSPLLYIQNDGYIGVGTASPNALMDIVAANATPFAFSIRNSTHTANTTFGYKIYQENSGYMTFYMDGAKYMSISPNGSVSYSKSSYTSPDTQLISQAFAAGNASYGFYCRGYLSNNGLSVDGDGNVGINQLTATAKLHIKGINSISSNYALKVDNLAGNPLFYVRNDGNIGIGVVSGLAKVSILTTSDTALDLNSDSTTDTIIGLATNNSSTQRAKIYLEDSTQTLNVYTLNNDTIFWNGNGLAQSKTLTLFTDTTAKFENNLGVGVTASSNSRVHIQGVNSTSSGYALKIDNSASSPLLYVRNDGSIGMGVSPTNNRVTIQDAGGVNSQLVITSGSGATSFLAFSAGNQQLYFDAVYYGSAVIAKHTTATGILSLTDQLRFCGNTGLTVGNSFSYNTLMNIDITTGNMSLGLGASNGFSRFHNFGIDATTKSNQRLEPVANVTEDTTGNTVVTTDATANVTSQTIAVPADKVISLESTIVYRKTGGAGVGVTGDGTTIKLNSSVKNVGGTLTLDTVQNTYTGTTNAIAGVSATYTISGTNVLVSVTGVLNDNITWNVITKVNTVA